MYQQINIFVCFEIFGPPHNLMCEMLLWCKQCTNIFIPEYLIQMQMQTLLKKAFSPQTFVGYPRGTVSRPTNDHNFQLSTQNSFENYYLISNIINQDYVTIM